MSVSVLVQFSFPGPVGGVLYICSFFALSDVSLFSSGYGALWSIDELFRQQNTFWKGLQMTFVIRPRPCCLSYCCFLFFCLKFEFLHYSVLCSQWIWFSLNEPLKRLHPQQWWDKNDAPTGPWLWALVFHWRGFWLAGLIHFFLTCCCHYCCSCIFCSKSHTMRQINLLNVPLRLESAC